MSRDQSNMFDTTARYATAWLDHGVDPTDRDYEFAIVVNRPSSDIRVNIIIFIVTHADETKNTE